MQVMPSRVEGGAVPEKQKNDLGSYLRARRERLDPTDLGLRSGTRRRTPGLRREEVAERADVSVEWYTRLEQGRGGAPSAQVLHSVAGALLLSRIEREHVFLLAHGPQIEPSTPRIHLGERYQRVLSGFVYGPAYVKTAAWDIVAWNESARRVLTDYPSLAPQDRNVLKILFLQPEARSLLADWYTEARLAVSTFRLELARWGTTKDATVLIEELLLKSEDFARLWDAQVVGTLGEGVKQLQHPVAGALRMTYSSYAIDELPGMGLVLYTSETDDDDERIRMLLKA